MTSAARLGDGLRARVFWEDKRSNTLMKFQEVRSDNGRLHLSKVVALYREKCIWLGTFRLRQ